MIHTALCSTKCLKVCVHYLLKKKKWFYRKKGTVNPKILINSLTPHPHSDGKSSFVVHKEHLELHSKTQQQRCSILLNTSGLDLKIIEKGEKHKLASNCSSGEINDSQFGILGLLETWIMSDEVYLAIFFPVVPVSSYFPFSGKCCNAVLK